MGKINAVLNSKIKQAKSIEAVVYSDCIYVEVTTAQ